ncbi:MAG TPA: glycosyltransferase [Segetibacter sp.]
MKVTYYQRKPRTHRNFSVENYFNSMRKALPTQVEYEVVVSKYESSGFFKRLYNCIEATFRQGDVNHITGDIHYVNYFLKKKKTILTVLDCGRLLYLQGLKFHLFKILWFVLPANKSRYITTISTATKQDLLKYIKVDPDKIFVVPVCISSSFSRYDKSFNEACPRILQIGTAPNKNLERLVLALKDIKCELVIIGHISSYIRNLTEENGIKCINFDKPLSEEEIIEEYKKTDIVTLVSTLEGFGMPIVEANTVGRVVITANNTSMPEVAGNAAHLVNAFSVEDIRAGFIKIINNADYRNRLIQNGYLNCERFSREVIAKQFVALYRAIRN